MLRERSFITVFGFQKHRLLTGLWQINNTYTYYLRAEREQSRFEFALFIPCADFNLHDKMALKFFNTLSRSVQEFVPQDPAHKRVRMYCCGPTVYDVAH